jgi:flagellar export protein FliJ
MSAGGAATSWRLAPLLAIRAREEARWRDELGRALALARHAEAEAEMRRTVLARRERGWPPRAVSPGAGLARAARFVDRLRRETERALERAWNARTQVDHLRERLLRARDAREELERAQERWLEERRRTREARLQGELDDLGARGRPHPMGYRVGP